MARQTIHNTSTKTPIHPYQHPVLPFMKDFLEGVPHQTRQAIKGTSTKTPVIAWRTGAASRPSKKEGGLQLPLCLFLRRHSMPSLSNQKDQTL